MSRQLAVVVERKDVPG